MKATKLPEPVIIPGIMQYLREIKNKVSLDIMDMTYEEERAYLDEKNLKKDNDGKEERFVHC